MNSPLALVCCWFLILTDHNSKQFVETKPGIIYTEALGHIYITCGHMYVYVQISQNSEAVLVVSQGPHHINPCPHDLGGWFQMRTWCNKVLYQYLPQKLFLFAPLLWSSLQLQWDYQLFLNVEQTAKSTGLSPSHHSDNALSVALVRWESIHTQQRSVNLWRLYVTEQFWLYWDAR